MKKVIVTGASGGIGSATVKKLTDIGYFVYALDIRERESTENIRSFVCDLTKEDEIRKVHDIIAQDGEIDGIIHLGGTYYMDSLIEIDEAKLKKIFDINFFSVYLVNKVFLDLVKKNGRIVIISSEVAPLDPLPFNGIYSLTKNTLENYSVSLRQELNLLDIKVIVVRPGAVNTGLLDVSIQNVERIEKETVLYKDNAPLFKKIIEKNETKTIEPEKLGEFISKIMEKSHPKLVYSINLNPGLIILSSLPKRLQLFIIKKMITPKKKTNKSGF